MSDECHKCRNLFAVSRRWHIGDLRCGKRRYTPRRCFINQQIAYANTNIIRLGSLILVCGADTPLLGSDHGGFVLMRISSKWIR